MITYLDLLPNDILDIIENNVITLYREDHKEKLKKLHIEFNSFWLIALWERVWKK